MCEDKKRCSACTHPISLTSFYSCIDCDFILHQNCAGFPKMKWHVLNNERLTLATRYVDMFQCWACRRMSNGFRYQFGDRKQYQWEMVLDVLCGSVSEPFSHPSHPDHLLSFTSIQKTQLCNGCNFEMYGVLSCTEEGFCRFAVCFKCATLPHMVKHRVDDHPLLLCYGEEASGIYWCDICEKETDPKSWFYTCKDHRASLHPNCVIGSLSRLMPRRTINILFGRLQFEVVLNNSISRPVCSICKLHCIFPIMLKILGTSSHEYFCSSMCAKEKVTG